MDHTIALANNTLYVSRGDYLVIAYAATPTTDVTLINPAKVGDGNFRFGFTNTPGATFTVWAATNAALPLANWTPLGLCEAIFAGPISIHGLAGDQPSAALLSHLVSVNFQLCVEYAARRVLLGALFRFPPLIKMDKAVKAKVEKMFDRGM